MRHGETRRMKSTYASLSGPAAPKIVCEPRSLPREKIVSAADVATKINPTNGPPLAQMAMLFAPPTREQIAVVTTKWWHTAGVHLTVGFLDGPPSDLRAKILSHMNAWGAFSNVQFTETATDPQVRIARTAGDGYWSYLGTDVLSIAPNEPTMNLDSFTMDTPDSEFYRVVRHETGHTIGCPHEHLRRELVDQIDPEKAIAFYGATQGWSADMVRQQVLTPIEESSLLGTNHADPDSIMCYQIPGSVTKDGQPIIGGDDIDDSDRQFIAKIYPQPNLPAARELSEAR